MRLQKYLTNTKSCLTKKFLEILNLFSQPEFQEKGKVLPKFNRSCDVTGRIKTKLFILSFSMEVQAEKADSGIPKTFYDDIIFVFVEYFYNRSHKMRTKHSKYYILILAIANYRNWIDASPSLKQIY